MTDPNDPFQTLQTHLAVLEHRVKELEHTPPRVNHLEHSVGQLELQFKAMNEDLGDIKQEGKETHGLVLKLGEDVRRLFYTGVVIASLASALLLGLKLYDTWQSIRQPLPQTQPSTSTQGTHHVAKRHASTSPPLPLA